MPHTRRGDGAIVITGASTGIGRAAALALAEMGFHVFAGVRREADGESLRSAAKGQLTPIILDVTNAEQIEAAKALVEETVGDRGLAGLFNNAGIGIGGVWEFIELDDVRRQLEVNFFCQVAVTQAFLGLLRQGKGRILFTGSLAGFWSMPTFGPYAASKHCLEALTDSLRRELIDFGVEVILLEPGSIDTPIWDKAKANREVKREKIPPQAIELYGDLKTSMEKFVDQAALNGISSDVTADVICRAMTCRKPRTRYRIGADSKLIYFLTRWLPDRALDRFFRFILADAVKKAG